MPGLNWILAGLAVLFWGGSVVWYLWPGLKKRWHTWRTGEGGPWDGW